MFISISCVWTIFQIINHNLATVHVEFRSAVLYHSVLGAVLHDFYKQIPSQTIGRCPRAKLRPK